MLPVSNAIFSGVAPLAPGLSTGSVFLPWYSGEPSSKPGDGGADQFDMADLLGADALQQILVRLGRRVAAEIDALEQVLHHCPHLAELAAQAFLQGVRGGRIRLVGRDLVDQQLHVQVHGCPSVGSSRQPTRRK